MIRAALPSTLALALCCLYLASWSTASTLRGMERSIAEANRFIDSMK
jgi:hypothetical protein